MKNPRSLLGTLLFVLGFASIGQAGPLVANCWTSTNMFHIMVFQSSQSASGTSPAQAIIEDIYGKPVGRYQVGVRQNLPSVRSGGTSYVDSRSSGETFSLEGPTKEFGSYVLSAIGQFGPYADSPLFDTQLNCQMFNGKELYAP